jgi:hypothetical protein
MDLDAQVQINPKGMPRMSQVLIDFLDPFLTGEESLNTYRTAMTIACTAWNASLLPPPERERIMRRAGKMVPGGPRSEERATFEAMFKALMQRRIEDFAEITRIVYDVEVLELENGSWHVNAASSLAEDG